jgi:hypothetical protein
LLRLNQVKAGADAFLPSGWDTVETHTVDDRECAMSVQRFGSRERRTKSGKTVST